MFVIAVKAGADVIIEGQLLRIFHDESVSCLFHLAVSHNFSPAFVPHTLFLRLLRENGNGFLGASLSYGKGHSSGAMAFGL